MFFHPGRGTRIFPMCKGGPEFFYACKGGTRSAITNRWPPVSVKNDSSFIKSKISWTSHFIYLCPSVYFKVAKANIVWIQLHVIEFLAQLCTSHVIHVIDRMVNQVKSPMP